MLTRNQPTKTPTPYLDQQTTTPKPLQNYQTTPLDCMICKCWFSWRLRCVLFLVFTAGTPVPTDNNRQQQPTSPAVNNAETLANSVSVHVPYQSVCVPDRLSETRPTVQILSGKPSPNTRSNLSPDIESCDSGLVNKYEGPIDSLIKHESYGDSNINVDGDSSVSNLTADRCEERNLSYSLPAATPTENSEESDVKVTNNVTMSCSGGGENSEADASVDRPTSQQGANCDSDDFKPTDVELTFFASNVQNETIRSAEQFNCYVKLEPLDYFDIENNT